MAYMFFLGAADPEMYRIEAILTEKEKKFCHAMRDGKPVHPGNAYFADPFPHEIPSNRKVVFVECAIHGMKPDLIIDHHRPGDPGYDKGPKLFWQASSLGQLSILLGHKPNPHDKILAAMDHCFNAAMHDECPGVSASQVMHTKIEAIAKRTGSAVEKVSAEIERFRSLLSSMPTVKIGEQAIYDLEEDLGIGYSLQYLAAQVAAVAERRAVILHLKNEENGAERLHLSGDVNQETVSAFLTEWAPAHNLSRLYGVPERGYAGGYRRYPACNLKNGK